MANNACLPERISKLLLSVLLILGGIGFSVIALTVLPVIGFVFAIPMLVAGGYFYRVHLNDRCSIEESRQV